MDYLRNLLVVGDNIMDRVTRAIDNNDFDGLADDIRSEVEGFSDEMRRMRAANEVPGARGAGYTYPGGGSASASGTGRTSATGGTNTGTGTGYYGQTGGQHGPARPRTGGQAYRTGGGQTYRNGSAYDQGYEGRVRQSGQYYRPAGGTFGAGRNEITPFTAKKPGTAFGLGKMVCGIIGLGIFVPAFLLSGIAALTGFATAGVPAVMALTGGLSGVFGALTGSGVKSRNLRKKFYQFAGLVGKNEYIDIPQLSALTHESQSEVQQDLDKMMSKGFLPGARYDETKKTLMLTDHAFQQYLDARQAKIAREEEQAAQEAKYEKMGMTAESRKVIEEGEAFLQEIRKANDDIPGQEMSDKLSQLEHVVSRIFEQVRKDPSTAGNLRKFMSYYVPTTRKLLQAYIALERQPEVGTNIVSTKREIEETIDTINQAYENLLDSLFADVAWDISSDISVMRSMMEQDGLTGIAAAQAKAKAEADAHKRAEAAEAAQAKAREQAAAAEKAKAEAREQAMAAEKAREEAEAKAKAEARTKAEAEAKARAEEAARAQAEAQAQAEMDAALSVDEDKLLHGVGTDFEKDFGGKVQEEKIPLAEELFPGAPPVPQEFDESDFDYVIAETEEKESK